MLPVQQVEEDATLTIEELANYFERQSTPSAIATIYVSGATKWPEVTYQCIKSTRIANKFGANLAAREGWEQWCSWDP
ncbi:hypothetical protein KIN20_034881, partial [Parelaphostrongylus tenuis]